MSDLRGGATLNPTPTPTPAAPPSPDRSSFYSGDPDALPLAKGPEDMPQPGWWEAAGAGWRLAKDDWPGQRGAELKAAYFPVIEALAAETGKSSQSYLFMMGQGFEINDAQVFRDLAQVRQRRSDFLRDVPGDADAFAKQLDERTAKRRASDKITQARDQNWGSTIGGFAGGAADPFNLATLPIGGGGASVARRILSEALVNAATEAVEQPLIAAERQTRGETLTAGEAAANIAIAGAVGAGMQGLIVEPLSVLVRRKIGAGRLTPDEVAAAHVIDRQADIAATSPFGVGSGAEVHAERLQAAISAILDTSAPSARARALAGTSLGSSPPPVAREGAAVPRETSAVPSAVPRDQLKASIRQAESGGGDDFNEASGAMGPYQFLASTWVRHYVQRYGRQGLSDVEIAAKRRDPALNETLVNDLIAENAAALHRIGAPETAGNLYLMHFAGQGGAAKILRAAPDTPIEQLLSPAAIKANPFLRGKSAADVVAWAHARMKSTPPEATVRRELFNDDPAGDAEWAAAQRASEAANAEADAVAREQGGRDPQEQDFGTILADVDAAEPVRLVDPGEDAVLPARTFTPPSVIPKRNRPSDVIEFLADRGGVRDNEGHALRSSRDMGKVFVPRAGPLLRKTGMSIDDAGELLHEAGYFRERPTTAEVLDVIERGVNGGEKIYALSDAADMQARARVAAQTEEFAASVDQLEQTFEGGLKRSDDPELFDDILLAQAQGVDPWRAYAQLVNERIQNAIDRAAAEAKDAGYGQSDPFSSDRGAAFEAAADGGRRSTEPGTAQGSTAIAGMERPSAPPAAFDPLEAFDDPRGIGAEHQLQSLEHDLRVDATASPDALFQIEEGAAARPLSDILDELDADTAEIDNIRGCL